MRIKTVTISLNHKNMKILMILQLYIQFKRMIFKKKKQKSRLKILIKYNVASLI